LDAIVAWRGTVRRDDMEERSGDETRDRASDRAESALGELAQILVENPWMNQALQVAFGVRERASEAGTAVIRNLNLPTGHDVDRVARRLRALSERLEEVEDAVDRLNREVAELRRERSSAGPRASSQG
jgi:chromosome segregation ATPase